MPILGLAFGSFLNLCSDRIPRGQSIVGPPSRCDRCERRLSPLDLIPLVSYLWLRGRCRYCSASIPPRVFLVELVTGALFGMTAHLYRLTALTGVIVAYGSLLILMSGIDLEHMIIPDKLVIPGVVLAFAAAHFGPVGDERALGDTFVSAALGGALGMGMMLAIYIAAFLVYRSNVGFGFGDVKLGLLIGLITGFPEVLVWFAFVGGGLIAVFLLPLGLRGRREAIPYRPFLALGAIVTMMIGEGVGWYLDLFR